MPSTLVISVPGEQISLVKCVMGHTFLGETYISVATMLSCDKIPMCGCGWWLRYYNYLALKIVNKSRLRDFCLFPWPIFFILSHNRDGETSKTLKEAGSFERGVCNERNLVHLVEKSVRMKLKS